MRSSVRTWTARPGTKASRSCSTSGLPTAGTYRAEFGNLVSLSAAKRVRLGRNRVAIRLELHNRTNAHDADAGVGPLTQAFPSQAALVAAQVVSTSYFGRVTSIVAPRLAKASVGFEW